MSKKQREKVEEEVTYHQNQNRIRAAGGPTSPDPWTGPDSTAPTEPIYTPQWTPMDSFTQHSNQWGTQIPNPTNNPTQLDRQFEEFTNVDSTTPAFDPPRISLTGEPESPGFPQGNAQSPLLIRRLLTNIAIAKRTTLITALADALCCFAG